MNRTTTVKVRTDPTYWMDTLPTGVCERIARHLSHGKQSIDVLSLALTSPYQRKTVLATLSNTLCICASAHKNVNTTYWSWLCEETILHLDIRRNHNAQYDRNVFSLFWQRAAMRFPIASATVYDDAPFLQAIEPATILELQVILGDTQTDHVFHALQKVRGLRKLTLICQEGDIETCRFDDIEFLTSQHAPPFFQGLESCHVVCLCGARVHPMWRMLPALSALQELTLYERPPTPLMHRIGRVNTLHLIDIALASPLLMKFGDAITKVVRPRDISEAKHLSVLLSSRRLDTLLLDLTEKAEVELANLVTGMRNLKVLGLNWHESQTRSTRPQNNMYYSCHYVQSEPNALLRMVQNSTVLEDLRLEHIRINATEIEDILAHLGDQLQRFSTTIADQDECPFQRIERLIIVIGKHNRRLRFWHVCDGMPIYPTEFAEQEHLKRLGNRLRVLMLRLRQNRPTLQALHIFKIVNILRLGMSHSSDDEILD